jgi:uncharacterized protein YdhG (YjbR/CyaY superfamily)
MTAISNHDAYIAEAPPQFQPVLRTLREQLARTLPDAEEAVKYGMPGFQLGTSIVASYAAFSKQYGLYLAPGAITALADEISDAGLKATKSGITATVSRPIPEDLVERLVLASRKDLGL